MSCYHAVRQHGSALLPSSRASVGSPTTYLWLSEAQLAEAFARFVQVSHTHRRHQSNVPGPLEARRRASRRRMGSLGLDSYDTSNAEFGALFGARPSIARSRSVQWSPPTLATDLSLELPPPPPRPWFWVTDSAEEVVEQEQQENVYPILSQSGQQYEACKRSREALGALLKMRDGISRLSAADLRPVIDFLQSAEDEPRANNVLRVVQWIQPRKLTVEAFNSLHDIVLDKLRLATITPYSLRKVMTALPRLLAWQEDSSAQQALLESYSAFQDVLVSSAHWMTEEERLLVYRSLYNAIEPLGADYDSCRLALKKLSILSSTPGLPEVHRDTSSRIAQILGKMPMGAQLDTKRRATLSSLLTDILNASQEPAIVTRTLQKFLTRRDSGMVDVKNRVVMLMQSLHGSTRLDTKHWSAEEMQASWAAYQLLSSHYSPKNIASLFAGLTKRHLAIALLVGWHMHTPDSHGSHCLKPHEAASSKLHLSRAAMACFHEIRADDNTPDELEFVTFVKSLQDHGLSSETIITHIADLHQNSPHMIAQKVLARRHYSQAMKVYITQAQVVDAPQFARTWYESLSDRQSACSITFNALDHALEQSRRGKQTAMPEHVSSFLEHLATLFAHDTASQSPRQAFRRAWKCFRYLKDRGVVSSSPITRAMLHSGTMQPLQRGASMPDSRFRYVLRRACDTGDRDAVAKVRRAICAANEKPFISHYAR